jgi:hypothetical protein
VLNFFSNICLCNFLHLHEYHCWNFLRREIFLSIFRVNLNMGFSSFFRNNFIWEILEISLNFRIVKIPSNQSLNYIYCSQWV